MNDERDSEYELNVAYTQRGADPKKAWLLTSFDTWIKNPNYKGRYACQRYLQHEDKDPVHPQHQ
jgi:hypothetical protein